MTTNRLEAFSDGVLAIIITIMVLGISTPEGVHFDAIRLLGPELINYLLSFIYVGIYWANHHHLLYALPMVKGHILWANLHWLFWMSLIPVTTAWTGTNPFAVVPAVTYGAVLLMCAVSYFILQNQVLTQCGPDSPLAKAIGNDMKGKISTVAYVVGMVGAFVHPAIAFVCFVGVAIMWIVPDKRIEQAMALETAQTTAE
ncbi:TMEM175 family protein [Corynebacterium epidermidicanis]|uniref:Putative integral membrane protein n=1 Tax=Corynebacterium epidermidicanis TaxID=1050174 RepID=A0A0G3GSS2_9CORY|nr:TMEM175 family protein [Corynebacterium epidermidicanis]AKK04211.1 putative integral membrane protein [Corynebacterium epidermidicanis]